MKATSKIDTINKQNPVKYVTSFGTPFEKGINLL
jgi:hypothetical protein